MLSEQTIPQAEQLWQSDSIAKVMCSYFLQSGWPATVIISGETSQVKDIFILQVIARSLQKASRKQNTQQSWQQIYALLCEDNHPDFIYFPNSAKIKIGNSASPDKGSVRYLLQQVLPRFPLMGSERFILLADASLLEDEAESALLKSLEEPRPENHFFLAVENSEKLKGTIRSRAIEIPFHHTLVLKETPPQPWQRFWFFSGWQNSTLFELLQEHDFLPQIENFYAELSRSRYDFAVFDSFFALFLREFSQKGQSKNAKAAKEIDAHTRSLLLRLIFLPFYFSCRDLLLEGMVPTMGPLRFPKGKVADLMAILSITEDFFANLTRRYFGTIPGNLSLIYFHFLDRLMPHWLLE